MKKIILFLFVSLILFVNANAQINLKLSDKSNNTGDSTGSISGLSGKAESGTLLAAGLFLFFINPELVIENKKVYFGLTKEVSAGIYPYGRLAFEYTYIFRNYDRNHLRISYNYDFILQSNNFVVIWFSTGLGYFTDTEHHGFFPQVSLAMLIPVRMGIFGSVYPYFKARQTFVSGKENSNITDFSLGMGLILYY